mmetsp:Transcript_117905/g.333476  ORF Transcript_117905/g.333476 Transcript_117905/m.333476 type:complete len:216 (+) Transcript_117905:1396-2043(+)
MRQPFLALVSHGLHVTGRRFRPTRGSCLHGLPPRLHHRTLVCLTNITRFLLPGLLGARNGLLPFHGAEGTASLLSFYFRLRLLRRIRPVGFDHLNLVLLRPYLDLLALFFGHLASLTGDGFEGNACRSWSVFGRLIRIPSGLELHSLAGLHGHLRVAKRSPVEVLLGWGVHPRHVRGLLEGQQVLILFVGGPLDHLDERVPALSLRISGFDLVER